MSATKTNMPFPICIVGGGLVGLMATLCVAQRFQQKSQKIALVAPLEQSKDRRTTAMLMPSVEMLNELGLWKDIAPHCAAMHTMRLVDGSKRLIRAPLTDFRASEIGLNAFGYNVPNDRMIKLLEQAITKCDNVHRIDAKVKTSRLTDASVALKLDNGKTVETGLAIAADGRNSILRQDANIETRSWKYNQTAIVLNFTHSLPHQGVSSEFHTETGPFTQVPLPPLDDRKHRSSLVWVVRPPDADAILNDSLDNLSNQIEAKLQSCFGKCFVEAKPASFPLSGMTAKQFGKGRTVLVGEAGHVFPPIGAQGFNLGVRDLKQLLELLDEQAPDINGAHLAEEYNRKRSADVAMRTIGVDTLNRSLLTGFLPVQAARALGLTALGAISPLRKLAMKQGMGLGSGLKTAM